MTLKLFVSFSFSLSGGAGDGGRRAEAGREIVCRPRVPHVTIDDDLTRGVGCERPQRENLSFDLILHLKSVGGSGPDPTSLIA